MGEHYSPSKARLGSVLIWTKGWRWLYYLPAVLLIVHFLEVLVGVEGQRFPSFIWRWNVPEIHDGRFLATKAIRVVQEAPNLQFAFAGKNEAAVRFVETRHRHIRNRFICPGQNVNVPSLGVGAEIAQVVEFIIVAEALHNYLTTNISCWDVADVLETKAQLPGLKIESNFTYDYVGPLTYAQGFLHDLGLPVVNPQLPRDDYQSTHRDDNGRPFSPSSQTKVTTGAELHPPRSPWLGYAYLLLSLMCAYIGCGSILIGLVQRLLLPVSCLILGILLIWAFFHSFPQIASSFDSLARQ
jgi:hypothetical protein